MAFKPMKIPTSTVPKQSFLSIRKFAGVNFSYSPSEVKDNESPDMLNMLVTKTGAIEKRIGYGKVYPTSLGTGQVNGLFEYSSTQLLIAWGTGLYSQFGSSQPVSIYSLKANARTKFFKMNGLVYIIDGTNYLSYNGSVVADVTTTAYIPKITINRKPDGSNYDVNEDLNLLSTGFIDSFSSDGVATTYKLSYVALDATLVTVNYNNVIYTEGVSFTVNKTLGIVDFTTGTTPLGAPALGTNNVLITAYKTIAGDADKIKKCRFFSLYGGQNDTRVFMAGNPSSINTIYYSEIYRPNYFPLNNFINVGSNAEAIMGFTLQYNSMIIHKRFSKWNLSIEFDSNGIAFFPVRPVNDTIGCIAEESIQLIDNVPMALTEKGVFSLNGSNVRDERNVTLISQNVDIEILQEPNITGCISVDYDQKYYLVFPNASSPADSKAYIWDYINKIWLLWDNMRFNVFLVKSNGDLVMGDISLGLIYTVNDVMSENAYSDNGVAINAYWKSKMFDFGATYLMKLIHSIFFSLRSGFPSSADLYYYTEDYSSDLVNTTFVNSFSYWLFNYAKFTYLSSLIPRETRTKIREKKVIFFQVKFENNRLNESMGILNLDIKYSIQREVK